MKPEPLNLLPENLYTRLQLIIQTIPKFWENKPYQHFTNQGPSHSKRVQQKLIELIRELPPEPEHYSEYPLSPVEIFVLFSAAWLYEIGMQSKHLSPILDFEFDPRKSLSDSQLQQIRQKKHLLTEELINRSFSRNYKGSPIELGLLYPDEYSLRIAETCRGCFDGPIEDVPEIQPVEGWDVRVRLLVALLRLADQLYIDPSRINLRALKNADFPIEYKAHWWVYQYVRNLPIMRGEIRFHYTLPESQKGYLGHFRALVEPNFPKGRNSLLWFLKKKFDVRLELDTEPNVTFLKPEYIDEISGSFLGYLNSLPSQSFLLPDTDTEPDKSELVKIFRELIISMRNDILDGQDSIIENLYDIEGNILAQSKVSESNIISSITEKLDNNQLQTIRLIIAAIEDNSIDDDLLNYTLESMRATLVEINHKEIVIPDEFVNLYIEQFSEVIHAAELAARHRVKISLPIIPLILSYEGEIELENTMNLENAWNRLVKWIRTKQHAIRK